MSTSQVPAPGAEQQRLGEDSRREANWKRWGTYLSERQWGTVREDYSADGDVWRYFPHDHAPLRAYRWGEDGLLGFTDRECRLCFAVALWNGRDSILKERLFGLTGHEGNHAEDCKEHYYYLDATPTHSYCKALYQYPQAEFPYDVLRAENARRGRDQPEYELTDTGVLDGNRYFDVQVEYAKASPDDTLIRITVTNHGPEPAPLWLLPTLWFRNTWIWGCEHEGCTLKPRAAQVAPGVVETSHETLGAFVFRAEPDRGGEAPGLLFTENESNAAKLWGTETYTPYVKDAFHEYVVRGNAAAVNPRHTGTKCAALYTLELAPGASRVFRLRLRPAEEDRGEPFGAGFDGVMAQRLAEADAFYAGIVPEALGAEAKRVQRQAYAGMLWGKQFYHYSVHDWLRGDPAVATPPESRWHGRNASWRSHLFNRDIISMPDKWEYPWYAAWDLAFQMIPFARIDPQFTKEQLILMLREWYMHPNGQIPAYEFALDDVNPPVHAWACWRVYKLTGRRGERDIRFLARTFQKLLINFTWWINRKDPEGRNLFTGGFLGLDNIGVFDRSKPLPTGGVLQQADATAWMAFYCSTLLAMAMELAVHDSAYEDVASKFFEHFVAIADAMNALGGRGLWDEQDGFYYDQIEVHGRAMPLKIRSMVGLIPLFAVQVLEAAQLERLPGFRRRMQWFLTHRSDLARHIAYMECTESGAGRHLLAIPCRERLLRVLRYVCDENEFLSPYGVRSLSRCHEAHPYHFHIDGGTHTVRYVPGESDSALFGGNSNWRGPVWMPLNFLLIESLEKYHHYYGDSVRIEYPTGSGQQVTLAGLARDLSVRLCRLFLPDAGGRRPCHGADGRYASQGCWGDLVLFHEYFHGDNGRGLGATHQTGWTGLVAKLLEDLGKSGDPVG